MKRLLVHTVFFCMLCITVRGKTQIVPYCLNIDASNLVSSLVKQSFSVKLESSVSLQLWAPAVWNT